MAREFPYVAVRQVSSELSYIRTYTLLYFALLFWYRLTRVVPEKGPLNGCLSAPYVRRRQKSADAAASSSSSGGGGGGGRAGAGTPKKSSGSGPSSPSRGPKSPSASAAAAAAAAAQGQCQAPHGGAGPSPVHGYGKLIVCKRLCQRVGDVADDPVELRLLYAQAVHYVVHVRTLSCSGRDFNPPPPET